MTPTNPHSSSAAKPRPTRSLMAARRLKVACLMLAGLLGAGSAYGLCPGEMEKAMKLRQRIVREWPLRPDSDEVSQYVQNLGVRLAERYGNAGRSVRWRFTLVRNLSPNAFSIGAGNIFVNEGAVSFAQNEAELAAVLAHELAHELAGHFCEESRSIFSGGLFDIFSAPDNSQPYNTRVGTLTQAVDPLKERQADQIALAILQASGYDPHAMLDVARRLPSGAAGHLPDAERIFALEQIMANLPRAMSGSSDEFRTAKHRLDTR